MCVRVCHAIHIPSENAEDILTAFFDAEIRRHRGLEIKTPDI